MFCVSRDVGKFEEYALPQTSGQLVMPDNHTVVSVDKNGAYSGRS